MRKLRTVLMFMVCLVGGFSGAVYGVRLLTRGIIFPGIIYSCIAVMFVLVFAEANSER